MQGEEDDRSQSRFWLWCDVVEVLYSRMIRNESCLSWENRQ